MKRKELRNVLFELVSDSNGHARSVESLLKMVRTDHDRSELPLQPRTYNFSGKNELEVMAEIAKIEKLMFDMYSDVREALGSSTLEKLLVGEGDGPSFMTILDSLIEDEARHMASMSKYASRLDRLR